MTGKPNKLNKDISELFNAEANKEIKNVVNYCNDTAGIIVKEETVVAANGEVGF